MPPKNPRPAETSQAKRVAPPRPARLILLVACASLAFTFAPDDTAAQEQNRPHPPATPAVRPRRTAPPKGTPEPQPAPTPAATPQPQPAPAESAEEVDEDEVVRVDSNLVIIPASVVDGSGRAITDLKVEDFELKIDGEVEPIGELTRSETPVHVALLFDNSASLSAAREFEKQAAVRFFQRVVRPIDRAAVYSISTVPKLAQGLTNDVPRLVRTIEHFGAPDGATALFDAVAQAADYMRPLPGRKVLVLVSDGTDTVSDVNFDEAVNRALRAECQVYVVQTRQVEDPSLHDHVSAQRMDRLSEQTGGAVYVPKTVEELDAVFTQISLDLSQQYLLSYYPQDERRDKYFRFIALRVKSRPTARVRARKGFYPDAAQATASERTQSANSYTTNNARPAPAADPPQRKRASAEAARQTARQTSAPARGGLGPDGPDTEEAARKQAAVAESAPTFTVTVSAPATEPAPPPAAPAVSEAKAEGALKQAVGEPSQAPLSGGVLNSKALRLPPPTYPAAAKNSGAHGRVVVEVTIDEQGQVVEARAVSGHSFLQQAAVQAARQARFTPALLSGAPVRVRGTINYVFTLP